MDINWLYLLPTLKNPKGLEWLFIFLTFLTVRTVVHESQIVREVKEQQIQELKKMCEQSNYSLKKEWEKKVRNNTSLLDRLLQCLSRRIHFVTQKNKYTGYVWGMFFALIFFFSWSNQDFLLMHLHPASHPVPGVHLASWQVSGCIREVVISGWHDMEF